MIYTVTLNPAIDYIVKTKNLMLGMVNRSLSESIYYGGKGINVSRILTELETDTIALGFIAGFTGKALADGLSDMGITSDFIMLPEGNTRINVKIKDRNETDINGNGPEINQDSFEKLMKKLEKLKEDDYLCLSGSVPASLPVNIYETIIKNCRKNNVRVVVDTTGEYLTSVLKYKPFIIKPNNYELEEIFKVKIQGNDQIVHYAKELKNRGACNVLVSLGGDGAILINENNEILKYNSPSGNVLNSVGAGDSVVAGFISGYQKTGNYDYALRLAISAGSATAFSYDLAKKQDIINIFNEISKI